MKNDKQKRNQLAVAHLRVLILARAAELRLVGLKRAAKTAERMAKRLGG